MIPRASLRKRITIEAYQGESAYGPVYGAPLIDVPARFDGKRRVVRKADGTDLIASGTLTLRPGVLITSQSRVTVPVNGENHVYEVVEVLPHEDLTRTHHIEVLVS